MGWNPFKSKKKIYVSSVVYNLAGEADERPNYLKSTMFGAVIGQENTGNTITQSLQNSYINGPGISYRAWYRWVRDNSSTYIGLPSANIGGSVSIATDDVVAALALPAGTGAWVQTAIKDDADYIWWAERYMLENRPDEYNSEWAADFDQNTKMMNITLASGASIQVSASDYDNNADYVYALYTLTREGTEGPIVEGTLETGLATEPDHTGYTPVSAVSTPTPTTLTTTVVTTKHYDNGLDDVTTTETTDESVTPAAIASVYEKTEYIGQATDSDALQYLHTILNVWSVVGKASSSTTSVTTGSEVIGGVVVGVTTTKVTTIERVAYSYNRRVDTQDITKISFDATKVLIYKLGSGGSLDKYIGASSDFGQFFPILPVRIDNKSISQYGLQGGWWSGSSPYYDAIAKAYKKLYGEDFKKLVRQVEDNDKIDDIDYACLNFGVSLNTKTTSCKRYIYAFFQALISYQTSSQSDYLTWKTRALQNASYQNRWNTWKAAQSNPADPLYGTAEPIRGNITKPGGSSIVIQSNKAWQSWYKIGISWNYIAETVHAGLGRAGAVSGDVWLVRTDGDPILINMYLANIGADAGDVSDLSDDVLAIYWQATNSSYRVLEISGLKHKNVVYQGKSVDTSVKDALNDSEESGFIIPLHYGVMKAMSLVHSTQVTSESSYLTFNCYQVVKTRWYQTGWFKIVLVIIIVIISVYTAGAGAGASAGVLGTSATVGAAIGFTGTAAIVAGTIANALAAMAISAVLMRVSTSLFGDKVGAIVGAIASMVALNVATSYSTTGSMAMNWGDMMSASNLLQATSAVQQSYQAYAADKLSDIQKEASKLESDYEARSEEISAKAKELMGYTGAVIDPMMFTDAAGFTNESANDFLSRTLMTGSDISALTHQMISEFTSLTMDLDTLKNM